MTISNRDKTIMHQLDIPSDGTYQLVQEVSNDCHDIKPKPKFALYGSVLSSCIGAFQFGWLTSQLNASNYHDDKYCNLVPIPRGKCVIFSGHSKFEWTFAVNAWIVGGAIGALTCSWPADKFGRKFVMLVNAAVMIVGAILQTAAPSIWVFAIGRLISGIASGSGTTVGTIYIGEVSPANKRGSLGSFLQLTITIGILCVTTVHFGLDTTSGWKYVVGFPIVLGVFQIIVVLLFVVESPRWLLAKGKKANAISELEYLYDTDGVDVVLKEIDHSKNDTTSAEVAFEDNAVSPWTLIFSRLYVKQLMVCAGICVAQQLSGINAVFYYSSDIFETAGIDDARIGTEIASGVNVLSTMVAVFVMDKVGRRTLLLSSSAVMILSAIGLTLSLNLGGNALSIVFTAVYVIGFEFGLGPIPWILVGEIFPENVRSYAGSVGTLSNWLGNLVVGISYPYIADNLEEYGFVPFVGALALIVTFIYFFVPETRNKTLEEIQMEFVINADERNNGSFHDVFS